MFSNPFNTRKDPVLSAIEEAMKDSELRRTAEAIVNEAFDVYSRNAVIREELADYDATIAEVYAALKEGKLDPVGHEDKDIDNDGDHDKSDKYLLNRRAVRSKAIKEEEQLDELSYEKVKEYHKKAKAANVAAREKHGPGAPLRKGTGHAVSKLMGIAKVNPTQKIDEISQELKSRYIDKAMASAEELRGKGFTKKFFPKKGPKAEKAREKMEKRVTGMQTAFSTMSEAAYSAKAARASEDIGKPGKMFSKIAKSAGEKYGSKERGEKVAGAILKRIRAKHMREEQIDELSAFGAEFAAARKAGLSQFPSKVTGKMTTTALKTEPTSTSTSNPKSTSVPLPPTKPVAGPPATNWRDPGTLDYSKSNTPKEKTPSGPPMPSMKEPSGPPMSAAPAPQNPDQNKTKWTPTSSAPAKDSTNRTSSSSTIAESVQVGNRTYRIV